MYSALEVAKFCGVVNQTAINWIRNNYLKAFKTPGGQFRVYPDDLASFMRKNSMQVPAEVLANCTLSANIQEKSVLLVDDDRAWNDVMSKFLAMRIPDLLVYQAFDGFEAGSQMVAKKPGVLVLDIDLPGIDGLKICKTIHEGETFGRPAVVVVTSLEDEGLERQCEELGVVKFLHKPVKLPELAELLCQIFGERS